MAEFIADFIKRLSSRKFIITIGGIAAVVSFPERAGEIVTLCVTFIGAEGLGDAAERYQSQKTKQSQNNLTSTAIELGALGDLMPGGNAASGGTIVPGSEVPAQ
jgi:hypothetical protein